MNISSIKELKPRMILGLQTLGEDFYKKYPKSDQRYEITELRENEVLIKEVKHKFVHGWYHYSLFIILDDSLICSRRGHKLTRMFSL